MNCPDPSFLAFALVELACIVCGAMFALAIFTRFAQKDEEP